MNDDVKLVTAFLALNAGVIALAIAGYLKGSMNIGAVLNPSTPIDTLEYSLELCDLVLIMSVNPGFGGQSFIENQVQKIRDLRRMCDERGLDPWIEVDGGIKAGNAWKVIEAGANAIVSGSGVFNQPDYAEAIKGIRNSSSKEAVLA